VRGKIKIGTSVFLVSILLASFFAAFEVPTAFASTTPLMKANSVVNPLLNPGDEAYVEILLSNAFDVWSVEWTLTFDTDLLTPTGYFFASGSPALFRNVFVADLNDAAGYVHLGASRPLFGGRGVDFLGVGDGFTTTYPLTHGVIQEGSVQAFYGVFNETLGSATMNYDPGPWTGGGGDGIVNRLPIIPSPYPGIECVRTYPGWEEPYEEGSIYGYPWHWGTSGNPADPYWQIDYTTGSVRTKPWLSRSRRLRSWMTAAIDYATLDGVPAIDSIDYAHSGGVGSVTFATPPVAGENVYVQYNYRSSLRTNDLLLAGVMIFEVQAKGACPLHIESSEMLDAYIPSNVITHNTEDGVFDNRLQGTMYAPQIIDTTLSEPGTMFDVYISVGPWMDKPLEKLWGFQFVLSFDPTIIYPMEYETLGIFMPGPIDTGPDYIAIVGNSYYGDPDGLTTNVPVGVVRIGFVVLDLGVSVLDLHDTLMADVNGKEMVHEVVDGSFANVGVGAALDTIFLEKRKISQAEGMMTLTAQVKNIEAGITRVRVKFTVLDPFGGVAAEMTTEEGRLPYDTTLRLYAELDLAGLLAPSSYDVEATMQFLNVDGTWTDGLKGSPNAHRTTMVKSFTLLL